MVQQSRCLIFNTVAYFFPNNINCIASYIAVSGPISDLNGCLCLWPKIDMDLAVAPTVRD